jgi:cation transport ATPase
VAVIGVGAPLVGGIFGIVLGVLTTPLAGAAAAAGVTFLVVLFAIRRRQRRDALR